MKIAFIGDIHLGAGMSLGKIDPKTQLNTRLLDFINTFDNIIDKLIERDVRVIVLVGDIFETRHPTSAQLNAFSKCIQRVINNKLEVIIVVGNHDQQRTISTTTVDVFDSLKISGLSIYSEFNTHILKDEHGKNINLILMPYRDRRMIGSKNVFDAVDVIQNKINSLANNLNGPKIAVGHFMIDKSITGENPSSFSINELILPINMFSNIDTVIMGHIHKHIVVSKKNPTIMYTGSMEKNSFGERQHQKVTLILDTNNVQNIEILPHKTRALFEMNFNYSEMEKCFKHKITDKIILDIERFNMRWNLNDTIVKFVTKVKKNDLYYVNQERIKEYILSKNVKYLMPMQVSSTNSRKLRNKKITENVTGKNAMATFIQQLIETEQIKRKLIKFANSIIEEVEGK